MIYELHCNTYIGNSETGYVFKIKRCDLCYVKDWWKNYCYLDSRAFLLCNL